MVKSTHHAPLPGQVAAFISGNQIIVHRILWPFKSKIVIHGDSSPNSLGAVNKQQMLGIVESLERNDKTIRWIFKSPLRELLIAGGFIMQILVSILQFRHLLLNRGSLYQ